MAVESRLGRLSIRVHVCGDAGTRRAHGRSGPIAREEFLDGVLRTVCDREQTVLLSTHSLDDVQRVADTVGFLCNGRIRVQRNIEELLASTKRIRAALTGGSPP